MGRPREHDAKTAAALVEAAERVVQAEGLDALTVRRVAGEAGTTTRAVYSLFGSKQGLNVALGQRAFGILGDGLAKLPETDDPAGDIVNAGIAVFRRFALEHPPLFRMIALQRPPSPDIMAGVRPAGAEALSGLKARFDGLEAAGLLGARTVWAAVSEFQALCEGLASVELRGQLPLNPGARVGLADDLPDEHAGEGASIEEQIWRDALTTLVRGFAVLPAADRAEPGSDGSGLTDTTSPDAPSRTARDHSSR
jgi:AcrR family transcriptional regulator